MDGEESNTLKALKASDRIKVCDFKGSCNLSFSFAGKPPCRIFS
jgi:hypothetical protein